MFNVRVNQIVLLNAIKRVQPVVPARHVIPIMTSVVLRADGDTLTLLGTDLDNSITSRVRAIVANGGDVLVNAKELLAAVRSMSSKDKSAMVHIQVEDSQTVAISGNGVTQRLSVNGDSQDYPTFPACESPIISLTAKQFQTITAMNFATQDYSSTSVLKCINLQINGRLDACATDGSRMVHFADSLAGLSEATINANIPHDAINLLIKAIDKKCNNIVMSGKFSMSGDRVEHLQFTDGGNGEHNTSVIVRVINSEYPRYSELFPTAQPPATITYDRLALLNAVKAGAKVNPKTHLIKLTGGHVEAVSESQKFSANIESSSYCDGDLPTLGINGNYLADWLEVIEDKQVTIELTGSVKLTERLNYKGQKETYVPATLKPLIMRDSKRDMRYLLMPVQCK